MKVQYLLISVGALLLFVYWLFIIYIIYIIAFETELFTFIEEITFSAREWIKDKFEVLTVSLLVAILLILLSKK